MSDFETKPPKTEDMDIRVSHSSVTMTGDEKTIPKPEERVSAAETAMQRRELRFGYLEIQNLIRDQKDEISAASSKKFMSYINQVNGMHQTVRKPREQVSDAEALRVLANTVMTSIRVHTTGSVTPSIFISSLIKQFGKKRKIGIADKVQISWKDIGLQVSPAFMTCRGHSTMLGPMKIEPKPPRVSVTRKRRRSIKEDKVKPEEVEDTVSKEKTETEKIIAIMFDILKVNQKVRLESLILNRISFAQTVENLFALSFLVKDGRVVIVVDANGAHYVSPKNAPRSELITSKEVVHSHFVFSLDFHDWKLMRNVVAEGSELMPHRTNKRNDYRGSSTESTPCAKSSQPTRNVVTEGSEPMAYRTNERNDYRASFPESTPSAKSSQPTRNVVAEGSEPMAYRANKRNDYGDSLLESTPSVKSSQPTRNVAAEGSEPMACRTNKRNDYRGSFTESTPSAKSSQTTRNVVAEGSEPMAYRTNKQNDYRGSFTESTPSAKSSQPTINLVTEGSELMAYRTNKRNDYRGSFTETTPIVKSSHPSRNVAAEGSEPMAYRTNKRNDYRGSFSEPNLSAKSGQTARTPAKRKPPEIIWILDD